MAYNSKNLDRKRAFVMDKYKAWKAQNGDIPDTFFVRAVLPKLGHSMCYSTFMKSYKHYEVTTEEKQLSIF